MIHEATNFPGIQNYPSHESTTKPRMTAVLGTFRLMKFGLLLICHGLKIYRIN
jgi:hypothetical protein